MFCRMTSRAVILDVSTNYSIEETALFYADKKLFQRHMKMQVPPPLRFPSCTAILVMLWKAQFIDACRLYWHSQTSCPQW